MKQSDVEVGGEYAFVTYTRPDGAPVAARVRLKAMNGHGSVTVQVADPGRSPTKLAQVVRRVKRNEELQVSAGDLECRWADWPERAEAIQVEHHRRLHADNDDWERGLADRVLVDPGRLLPEFYLGEGDDDLDDGQDRAALTAAYAKARDLGPYVKLEALRELLTDLPVLVVRDLIAASGRHNEAHAPGTVAATFSRAARFLEAARNPNRRALHPHDALGDADVAFLDAVRDSFAVDGGELVLPVVPPVPSWADEYYRETERPIVVRSLGWLRVAVGDTGRGDRLHAVDCRNIRSRPTEQVDHVPWWLLVLEGHRRLCMVCGGPGLRDLQALTGFAAAADVWRDRGDRRIERWQQAAALRLVAATSTARAAIGEPDVTLIARVATALAEEVPGDLGWAAYALTAAEPRSQRGRGIERFTPHQQQEAHVVARDRLAAAEAVLPDALRPPPLPLTVDQAVLRDRYAALTELLADTVPQLDRLLFTLPGAR